MRARRRTQGRPASGDALDGVVVDALRRHARRRSRRRGCAPAARRCCRPSAGSSLARGRWLKTAGKSAAPMRSDGARPASRDVELEQLVGIEGVDAAGAPWRLQRHAARRCARLTCRSPSRNRGRTPRRQISPSTGPNSPGCFSIAGIRMSGASRSSAPAFETVATKRSKSRLLDGMPAHDAPRGRRRCRARCRCGRTAQFSQTTSTPRDLRAARRRSAGPSDRRGRPSRRGSRSRRSRRGGRSPRG